MKVVRFHIHVVANGERVTDEDGGDFADLVAARREAVASAREIMAQRLLTGQTIPADLSLIITDAHGDTVGNFSMREIAVGGA